MIRAIAAAFFLSCLVSCASVPCLSDCPPHQRVGASCSDGTKTDNYTKSACSQRGGVACWRCDTKKKK